MRVLITGVAGFIGMHTARHLLQQGDVVIGIDNLNDYYDVALKKARLAELKQYANFEFFKLDIVDDQAISALFAAQQPARVIHLAAQAGVRHSLANIRQYIDTNLQGFINILENCRRSRVEHLIYASSSSVYGSNTTLPFSEQQSTDHQINPYGATKKANELLAHTYSHLFALPTTGLRFFTVYGPWGRPDMSLFLFTKAILKHEPIDIFGHGNMRRDFTYIDDVIAAIVRVADKPATPHADFDTADPDPKISNAPYRIFNVGNSQPVLISDCISILEQALGKSAEKNLLPQQPAEISATAADPQALKKWIGFAPNTGLQTGILRFVKWYKSYYSVH